MANDARRLGLTLSGGGFRAALFHVGVLARMAELDLLRRVEVISTVSGGSILGALYCLHLQALLETRHDADIGRDDYVAVVRDVEAALRAGARRNVRMRAYASPRAALRMAFRRDFSRSDRLAELYDELFYRGAAARVPRLARELAGRTGPYRVRMSDLIVRPLHDGANRAVVAKEANERRRAKIPMLYVNATTLNTGRRWVFTPTWMGERFGAAREGDPDVNAVLKGFRLVDAPDKYRDLPLAVAVAASAAVPSLFEPMPLTDLYDGWLPQLVDGGARDNLGIEGIRRDLGDFEFVVSDASDPIPDRPEPWPLKSTVFVRTFFTMWDRLHDQNVEVGLARGEKVIHTRATVRAREIAPRWEHARPRAVATVAAAGGRREPGIDPEVAEAIAYVRTDLDAFTDVEADALLAAGYLGADAELDPEGPPARGEGWPFAWIVPELRAPTPELMRHLAAARHHVGKTLHLGLGALVDRALAATRTGESAPAAASAALRAARDVALRLATTAREAAIEAAVLPFAALDLLVLDRLFLHLGRREAVAPRASPGSERPRRPPRIAVVQ